MYHTAFPQAMNESSCCSASSSAIGIVSFLDFNHCNRYRVIIIILVSSPWWQRCWVSLHMLVFTQRVFSADIAFGYPHLLGEVFVQTLCYILILLFPYCWYLRVFVCLRSNIVKFLIKHVFQTFFPSLQLVYLFS